MTFRSAPALATAFVLAASLTPPSARAAGPQWKGLRPGLSVEVEGDWRPSRGFVATEIDVHDAPADDVEIVAPLDGAEDTGTSLVVLGAPVLVPEDCRIRDRSGAPVDRSVLVEGAWVKIDADFSTERLTARRITVLPAPADVIEVDGLITDLDQAARVVRIGGIAIQLSRDTEVQGGEAVEVSIAVDDDDVAPAMIHAFGDRVHVGGRFAVDYVPEDNFDLNTRRAQDYTESTGSIELQLDARPVPAIQLVAKGGVSSTRVLTDEEGDEIDESDVRLQQLFALWRPQSARWLAVQLGRQDFDEAREWLYDENLDGVRVHARRGLHKIEASVSTRWDTESRALEDWTNWMLVLRRDVAVSWTAETYAIHRRLQDDPGNRPLWYGVRSEGRLSSGLRHWLEFARLDGRMEGVDKSAWAADAGLRLRLHRASRLSVTAGYATGSGGDPGSRFRQTGFHDNNDRFGGVASFRYYGELFDPELANLHVATAGIGFRPLPSSSIDLVAHRYRQRRAEAFLSSNVDARPRGEDPGLGFEWDVIVAFEEIPWLDVEYDFARFEPGDGFGPQASSATVHRLSAKFDF